MSTWNRMLTLTLMLQVREGVPRSEKSSFSLVSESNQLSPKSITNYVNASMEWATGRCQLFCALNFPSCEFTQISKSFSEVSVEGARSKLLISLLLYYQHSKGKVYNWTLYSNIIDRHKWLRRLILCHLCKHGDIRDPNS